MCDVLGTIQAGQDAGLRAGSRGALVVDGGPGTGKTVIDRLTAALFFRTGRAAACDYARTAAAPTALDGSSPRPKEAPCKR